jgi:hypothetical protein
LVVEPSGLMEAVRLIEALQLNCTYSSSSAAGNEDRVSSLCPSSGLGARKFADL